MGPKRQQTNHRCDRGLQHLLSVCFHRTERSQIFLFLPFQSFPG